jgi:hypothetical protein
MEVVVPPQTSKPDIPQILKNLNTSQESIVQASSEILKHTKRQPAFAEEVVTHFLKAL